MPRAVVADLDESFRRTLFANTLQLNLLRDLLASFERAGIRPTVMKGLAVAARYYPDLGARPMVDIDLCVDASENLAAQRVLGDRGFERSAPWRSFLHPDREFAVDLHAEPPSFLATARDDPTVPFELDGRADVWEPHAMLLHLLAHMEKHTRVVGVSLLWVVDVLRLVRAESSSLSLDRLRALSDDLRSIELLSQVLRMGERTFRLPIPDAFAAEAVKHAPLSLEWLLRQRRLKGWGFPGRRFYVRFPARVVGLRPYAKRPRLRWSDIPQGWLDLLVDRRTTSGGA